MSEETTTDQLTEEEVQSIVEDQEITKSDQVQAVKHELAFLKDVRQILKAYTKVGPSDAEKLVGVWRTLGVLIQRSEAFIREAKKDAKS